MLLGIRGERDMRVVSGTTLILVCTICLRMRHRISFRQKRRATMVIELLQLVFQLQLIVVALAALLIAMAYLLFAEMQNADRYRNALIRQRQRRVED
jgi:hypothetical protein